MGTPWVFIFVGTIFGLIGFVFTRFPAGSLDFLDQAKLAVMGVNRTPGGIRLMGIVFMTFAAAIVAVGVLGACGVIDMDG